MRRSLPHPSVHTEHTPIDLTHTPLDFPLSPARLHPSAGPHLPTPHAAAAHGHTPNQHCFCDCSSYPSIHRECGDRVSRFHHSSRRAFRLNQYSLTITSSPALAVRTSQLHCARSPVTATTLNLLTRVGIASLSKILVSRSLGVSFAFSSVASPGDILSGGSLSSWDCRVQASYT